MEKLLLGLNKLFNKVNLNKNPITGKIVSNMQEGPMRDLLKQFPKETLQLIVKIANEELKNK